ncbi:MAG TPA: LysM peptidoglycan-binding domain-containing protein [Bacillus bacterium]|nr:LysM peptidoglycan-binding domain-containing protein [Bacillus sp. (in: firmicutes)]
MGVIRALFILVIGLMAFLPTNANANSSYQVYVNDQLVSFQEPLFVENERLYVPIRFVGEQLGAAVEWKGAEQTVLIQSPIYDQLKFYPKARRVIMNGDEYIMDVPPLIKYERTYLPIRAVAEMLHLNVKWTDGNSIQLNSIPLYKVQEGDSLYSISQQFNTTAELIKERNKLSSDAISPEENLKVVVPYVMKNQNEEDLLLLAKLIEAEAGGESFNGQVAIGNVILNRVRDNRFPNTIKDVIMEAGQFTPVATGRINTVKPSQSAINAAKKALEGEKPVKNAVYFYNKANTTNPFLLAREVVSDIGNHRFTM